MILVDPSKLHGPLEVEEKGRVSERNTAAGTSRKMWPENDLTYSCWLQVSRLCKAGERLLGLKGNPQLTTSHKTGISVLLTHGNQPADNLYVLENEFSPPQSFPKGMQFCLLCLLRRDRPANPPGLLNTRTMR